MNAGTTLWLRAVATTPALARATSNQRAVARYLLMEVAAEPREVEHVIGRKCHTVFLEPGQAIAGRKSLAETLELPASTVQTVLKWLEREGFLCRDRVHHQTSQRVTVVTLCHWQRYGVLESRVHHQKHHQTGSRPDRQFITKLGPPGDANRDDSMPHVEQRLTTSEDSEEAQSRDRANITKLGGHRSVGLTSSNVRTVNERHKGNNDEKRTGKGGTLHESTNGVPEELRGLRLYETDSKLCARWSEWYESAKQAHPKLDVMAEVRKAHHWEVANPTRRKKQRTRYLTTWLNNAERDRRREEETVDPEQKWEEKWSEWPEL